MIKWVYLPHVFIKIQDLTSRYTNECPKIKIIKSNSLIKVNKPRNARTLKGLDVKFIKFAHLDSLEILTVYKTRQNFKIYRFYFNPFGQSL